MVVPLATTEASLPLLGSTKNLLINPVVAKGSSPVVLSSDFTYKGSVEGFPLPVFGNNDVSHGFVPSALGITSSESGVCVKDCLFTIKVRAALEPSCIGSGCDNG